MSTSSQHAALLAGTTGLVGSHILTSLLTHPSISSVSAFTRRDLPTTIADPNSRLTAIVNSDTATWSTSAFPSSPTANIFLSALGTTRGNAGSFANQRKIDYDLNLELAKKAQQEGTKVYVLISSGGADASSMFPYMKMKGEIEEAVKALDFEKVVILRPGLIVGDRRKEDVRIPEFVLRKIAGAAGMLGKGMKDFWAQDADVIAKAAVHAGVLALEGSSKVPEGKHWLVTQADVVRLGRTEWDEKWG